MCADIVYHDLGTTTKFDTTTWKNTINNRFGPKAKLEELKGWSVWDTHYSYGGLEAAAYKKDNNLVVAYRGSESNDFFDVISDWFVADLLGWVTGLNAQAPAAKSFIAKVMKENPGCNIYVTGHSLGGSLAYNAASKAIDVNSNRVKEVTVYNGLGLVYGASLGIFDMADNKRLENSSDKIFNYRVKGDIVSNLWLTAHYGTKTEYSISKDLDDNVIKAHSLYTFFEKMKPLNRPMN